MKLYLLTEEQLRKSIDLLLFDETKKDIAETLTPIELPSDEEIEKESSKWIAPSQAFRGGAKWMKEQILNQNK